MDLQILWEKPSRQRLLQICQLLSMPLIQAGGSCARPTTASPSVYLHFGGSSIGGFLVLDPRGEFVHSVIASVMDAVLLKETLT